MYVREAGNHNGTKENLFRLRFWCIKLNEENSKTQKLIAIAELGFNMKHLFGQQKSGCCLKENNEIDNIIVSPLNIPVNHLHAYSKNVCLL